MQWTRPAAHIAIPLITVFALGACGRSGGSPQSQPDASIAPEQKPVAEITITVSDGSIEIPATIGSEPTHFVLHNEGTRAYEAKFARLNEGVTMKDLEKSLKKGPDAALSLITLAGEIRRTAPSKTDELTIELAAGNYVVVDPRYTEQGLVQPFEVVAVAEDTEKPQADVDATLTDFAIDIPSTLSSGGFTIKVANDGDQAHEIFFLKEGEKPGRHSPGVTPFNPGSTVWMEFDLEAGNYTAVCFFPDMKTGKSHAALGMKTEVIIE